MRIGIFGGTFDPIHNGHLRIAELAYSRLRLDKLLFVPNSLPPHKPNVFSTPIQRFEMVMKAIEYNPVFEIEDYELKSKKFSYTYRTLTYISEKYPKSELFFIAGADNIKQIESWKRPDIIFSLAKVAFITRPGFEFNTDFKHIDRSVFLSFQGVDISSTEIRKRILNGKEIDSLVPASVNDYIKENLLYKYSDLMKKLKGYINPKRYEHSLGVAKEALKLAKIYSLNETKAYIAGLLHDCAKDIDFNKQIDLIKKYNQFEIIGDELSYPKILHALTGSIIAKRNFGIDDKEILSAIRYHTIGGIKMSPLDKIIFVADMIEPKRCYNGIEFLRELAYNNINKAIIHSIDNTVMYLGKDKIQKNVLILREFLKERENERI